MDFSFKEKREHTNEIKSKEIGEHTESHQQLDRMLDEMRSITPEEIAKFSEQMDYEKPLDDGRWIKENEAKEIDWSKQPASSVVSSPHVSPELEELWSMLDREGRGPQKHDEVIAEKESAARESLRRINERYK